MKAPKSVTFFTVPVTTSPTLIEANLCNGELDFHQLNNGPLFGEDTERILKEVGELISNKKRIVPCSLKWKTNVRYFLHWADTIIDGDMNEVFDPYGKWHVEEIREKDILGLLGKKYNYVIVNVSVELLEYKTAKNQREWLEITKSYYSWEFDFIRELKKNPWLKEGY